MAWFRVDDTLPMNAKALSCSLEALGLWALCGAWSCQQLTNGAIPRNLIEAFASRLLEANRDIASVASELVDAGMWTETPAGYQFHDWDSYQYTSNEVEELRQKRAKAGRKGGIKSGESRRKNTEANSEANALANTKQTRSKNEPHPILYIGSANAERSKSEANASPKKKRATPLPDNWQPTDAHATQALELGVHLTDEADKFRDHAKATGRTLKDWDAAFRNWLRNATQYNTRPRPQPATVAIDPWTQGEPHGNPF